LSTVDSQFASANVTTLHISFPTAERIYGRVCWYIGLFGMVMYLQRRRGGDRHGQLGSSRGNSSDVIYGKVLY